MQLVTHTDLQTIQLGGSQSLGRDSKLGRDEHSVGSPIKFLFFKGTLFSF
jgi:hypothetical protein